MSPSRKRVTSLLAISLLFSGLAFVGMPAGAQTSLTWEQVRSKFEAVNPALKADAFGVDELRAEEITAYLRPNPQFNFATDGTQFPPHKGPWTPLTLSLIHI